MFSIVAALLSGVASMVLGFLWYGPLFSKEWMKEVGLKKSDVENGPGVGYLVAFLASSIMGGATSLLINALGITEVTDALYYGLLLGGGYVGTTFLTNYIFAQKSVKLYLIDAGYQIAIVVIAAVIGALVR